MPTAAPSNPPAISAAPQRAVATPPTLPTFRPVIVLPTYNNASTLGDVVGRCAVLGLPMYLVDDGSTDKTRAVIASLSAIPLLTVIHHAVNQGKAGAMRTGFAAAIADGFTHAVTMDTDGQLDPEQIPQMLRVAEAQPTALVLGVRNLKIDGYPMASRVGRYFANLFIYLESGVKVCDSQCGLRIYPLGFISAITVRADRFGYETEVITRAGWAKTPVVEVPVSCRYFQDGKRVTHFRPWMDTLRAFRLHARLLGRWLTPIPHTRWPSKREDDRPWWKRLLLWVNPAPLWNLAREERRATPLALSVAVGVFIANLPIYGLHALLCLYVARWFRLHPLGVIAGSLLATPPLGVLISVLGIIAGHRVLAHRWLTIASVQAEIDAAEGLRAWIALFSRHLAEWTLGGTALGIAMGLAVYGILFGLVHLLPRRKAKPHVETAGITPDSTPAGAPSAGTVK